MSGRCDAFFIAAAPRARRAGLARARASATLLFKSLLFKSLALASLALGCGRKATVEDCQQIVKRIVELELGKTVPAQELGSEVQEAQGAMHERALSDCVGRRITEKSLKCVATAQTAEAIIDDCFD
jgi:hypothetical protein